MIKSLVKAFEILQLFNSAEPRLTLAQISERLGYHKSTTYNLLATLLELGYVEKPNEDQYALGTATIRLTQSVRVNCEIRDRVSPLLRELANTSQESVYLTVLDGEYCLYIYAIETSTRLLARTAVGERGYLHRTAVGKAMLAFLPQEQVDAIIDQTGLPGSTEYSITDHVQLQQELEESRERGYALDRGENEINTYCVAAPIFDASGQVVASCSISGMDPEIVGRRLPELASYVMHSTLEASRRMGYVPFKSSDAPAAFPAKQTREKMT